MLRLTRLLFFLSLGLAFTQSDAAEPKPYSVVVSPEGGAAYLLHAPIPDYPYEARWDRITGHGTALLTIDRGNGRVTSVTMPQSTRHRALDQAMIETLRVWRIKPGTVGQLKVSVRFSHNGYSE